jgi:hypothetical protein
MVLAPEQITTNESLFIRGEAITAPIDITNHAITQARSAGKDRRVDAMMVIVST